jgi:hypothetical protein
VLGPQTYDKYLYYSFGGVAGAIPEAYLTSMCSMSLPALRSLVCRNSLARRVDLKHVGNAAALGNLPLWFGNWALSTNFDASAQFRRDRADAQKMMYSAGAG